MSFERDLPEKALVEVWTSLIDLSDVVAVRALARLALASPRLAQIEWVWTARPLYGPVPVWVVRSSRLVNLSWRCLAADIRGPDSPVTPTKHD